MMSAYITGGRWRGKTMYVYIAKGPGEGKTMYAYILAAEAAGGRGRGTMAP